MTSVQFHLYRDSTLCESTRRVPRLTAGPCVHSIYKPRHLVYARPLLCSSWVCWHEKARKTSVIIETNESIEYHRGLWTNKETTKEIKTATSQTNCDNITFIVCPVLKPGDDGQQNMRRHQNYDAARVDAGIAGSGGHRNTKMSVTGLTSLSRCGVLAFRCPAGLVVCWKNSYSSYCQLQFLSGWSTAWISVTLTVQHNTVRFDSGGLRLYFEVQASLVATHLASPHCQLWLDWLNSNFSKVLFSCLPVGVW